MKPDISSFLTNIRSLTSKLPNFGTGSPSEGFKKSKIINHNHQTSEAFTSTKCLINVNQPTHKVWDAPLDWGGLQACPSTGESPCQRVPSSHPAPWAFLLGPRVTGLVSGDLHTIFLTWFFQPLDVMGKPWANYHLEMQLLQDALKLARRDRGVVSNYTSGSNIGSNGGTML